MRLGSTGHARSRIAIWSSNGIVWLDACEVASFGEWTTPTPLRRRPVSESLERPSRAPPTLRRAAFAQSGTGHHFDARRRGEHELGPAVTFCRPRRWAQRHVLRRLMGSTLPLPEVRPAVSRRAWPMVADLRGLRRSMRVDALILSMSESVAPNLPVEPPRRRDAHRPTR